MRYSKVRAASTVKVVSKEHGKIEFVQIPTTAKNVITTQAIGNFGSILVNEIEATNQKIWHSHFEIKANTHLSLALHNEIPSLRFLFSLKDNMKFRVSGLGKSIRLKHQYNLVYNRDSDIEYLFRKGKEYAAVVIFMRYEWLQFWSSSLPVLANLLKQIELEIPIFISKTHTAAMRDKIQELLTDPDKTTVFVEAKVLELLNLAIKQIGTLQSKTNRIKLNRLDVKKIEEARDYIQEHIAKPMTIIQLSKEVGLNEYKLKHGFKQLLGFTIHGFVSQERMQLASKLLRGTDMDIKKISKAIGFKSDSHFSAAFKKHFGYSARSIKRGSRSR